MIRVEIKGLRNAISICQLFMVPYRKMKRQSRLKNGGCIAKKFYLDCFPYDATFSKTLKKKKETVNLQKVKNILFRCLLYTNTCIFFRAVWSMSMFDI